MRSGSNWNLEVLIFAEREYQSEYAEKNLSEKETGEN